MEEGEIMPKKKPKWDEKDAVRRGRAASGLAKKFREKVEPRLDAGTIDGLEADVATLDGSKAARIESKTAKKGKTGAKRDVSGDAHELIIDIREAVLRTDGIGDGVKKTFGVGDQINPSATDKIKGVLSSILAAFAADPALARRIGVLEEDIAAGRRLLEELTGASRSQVEAAQDTIEKTFDRNVVQLRVEAAVDAISSRGRLAFRADPAVRERFMALVSSTGPAAEDLPSEPSSTTTPPTETPA
jgi:hypothetical protein